MSELVLSEAIQSVYCKTFTGHRESSHKKDVGKDAENGGLRSDDRGQRAPVNPRQGKEGVGWGFPILGAFLSKQSSLLL